MIRVNVVSFVVSVSSVFAGCVSTSGKSHSQIEGYSASIPTREPNRTRTEIMTVMQGNKDKILNCFSMANTSNLKKRLSVKTIFVIEPDGEISTCLITQSNVADKIVEECIVEEIKKFKFPLRALGRATVHYPYVYTPTER